MTSHGRCGEVDCVAADDIGESVRQVRARIERAASRAGRDPGCVRLVAVTKSVDEDRIRAAIDAGVTILGESRLQEAVPKIERISRPEGLVWHFIGRLQRRKVKAVIGRFEMIHSVDSLALASEINHRAEAAGVHQSVLIEVNLGGEPSKAGFAPEALLDAMPSLDAMPHLAMKGLMTIPPAGPNPEAARPYFRRLRELVERIRQDLATRPRRVELLELSMGMSQDFDIAVEEGATFVRVGTAIFGARVV
jgi:pyridoxal phosphate enzyme (YggS family)